MNEDDKLPPFMVSRDCTMSARATRFERDHARRLRALAYRMLGSNADAEDVVQDAWLRWAELDETNIDRPAIYLSRIVTNLCLDRLGAAATQRERYVGVWLPEPLLNDGLITEPTASPEQQAEFAEDVSIAFMLALERLSPLERAAFLLHDVFDVDYAEIARHLEREPATCRQLVSRARRSLKADYIRREVSEEEGRFLVEAFANALQSHDADALARVLAADAVLMSDGGGKVSAAARPLRGGASIARALVGFARLPSGARWRFIAIDINGLPGCLIIDGISGQLVQTVSLAPAGEPGHISAIYVQRNPDKLGNAAKWLASAAIDVTGDLGTSS